jgi:hypothetical protein
LKHAWDEFLHSLVSDAPGVRATALFGCSYSPDPALETGRPVDSAEALVAVHGPMIAAEIQRLRINREDRMFVVLHAGIGYVQCQPEKSPEAIYCEAQSAESWPALAAILTPEHVALLHKAGYADPGRAPNYWKSYPFDKFDDAAVARELLTILHDVYGYNGATKLKVSRE